MSWRQRADAARRAFGRPSPRPVKVILDPGVSSAISSAMVPTLTRLSINTETRSQMV